MGSGKNVTEWGSEVHMRLTCLIWFILASGATSVLKLKVAYLGKKLFYSETPWERGRFWLKDQTAIDSDTS